MTCFNAARSSWQANPHRSIVPADQANHVADSSAPSLNAEDWRRWTQGQSDNGLIYHQVMHRKLKAMINQQVQRLASECRDAIEELHQDFASLNQYAKHRGHWTSALPPAPKARKWS